MGDILSGETQLFILLKDCINFLLHLVLLLWKIHEVLATNNIPHQHCQVQHSRQHHSHTPLSYNYPQELQKEICWPTFLDSLVYLKREVYSTYFSVFFSILFFFLWLLIKAQGRCDQSLCDCSSLSRAGRCRALQVSSELCHWLHQNPPAPPALVLQLYTQYKLWARGGCRGASIQGAANCRVSIIPTELSPGAAGCRVNFPPFSSSMLTLSPSSSLYILLITWASLISGWHNLSSSNLSH